MVTGYMLDRCEDLEKARARIRAAGLTLGDEATSHVMALVDKDLDYRPPQPVLAAWLMVDAATAADIGMALVAGPAHCDSCEGPVLHLYVDTDHQHQGIGAHLLAPALADFPDLHGHYNLDSVRLYAASGLPPANLPLDLAASADPRAARQAFIAGLQAERERFDAQVARLRPMAFT